MTMDGPTVSDSPLGVYISTAWCTLSPNERDHVRQVIDRLVGWLHQQHVEAFVGIYQYPPAENATMQPEATWLALREQMSKSHLFLLLNSGTSERTALELVHAVETLTPTLVLVRNDGGARDVLHLPGLVCLQTLVYNSVDEAEEALQRFWLLSRSQIERARAIRSIISRSIANQVGETIHFLRNQRGWTTGELASMVGVPRQVIAALEKDSTAYIPSQHLLAAIALALGVELPHLYWPPERWEQWNIEALVVRIALEDDWPLQLLENFRTNMWRETRLLLNTSPTEDEVRIEMRLWQWRKREGLLAPP